MKEQNRSWDYPNITPPDRPKKEYLRSPSLIDQSDPDSELNKSSFRGFYNMMIIFILIFLFTKPLLNKLENDYFLEPHLYNTFKNDYFLCLMIWPLFFLWSFNSFLLQKAILKGVPNWFVIFYQHFTQAGLFMFSSYLILKNNWCSTHAAFVILQACVHFMKMHSYTTVNRDYREHKILTESMVEEQKKQANPSTTELKMTKKQSKIAETVNYPNNINVADFILFMMTPWLVYDVYPRRDSISIIYIIKKSFYGLTAVLICYIIYTQYVMPTIQLGLRISFIQLFFSQMLPATFIILIMFFLTFEFITNIFAEITKLDHRVFYEDWWNSTTYEEFNRKWNKPVHFFLYRHVYLELLVRWKTSKQRAQFLTFLFSALLHEFLLAMIFRIIRPIFLGFIIFQIPLIYFTKWMEGKKSGAYLFWLGIILGPSLIISFYLRSDEDVALFFTRP